jgi:DNA polymerase III subunit delta'
MSWQGIEGHDDVVEQFRRSLERGRLASTFLFIGPAGIGKRTFAMKLAQTLLCERRPVEQLDPCGTCTGCVQVLAATHPDLLLVSKPADKSVLPVELFIGTRERRMQEGLCHDIRLKPFMGGRRVAVIDDADALNEESANCLLKTLEEPPPRSVMILIGTSADRQLPTIRSRSQIIRFRPLPPETVAQLLLAEQHVPDLAAAQRLAEHSEGSLARALELADPDLWTFRGQLLTQLSRTPLDLSWAKTAVAFVEAAGKEASTRRARARQVIGFAAEFHRQLSRSLAGLPGGGDAELEQAVARLVPAWQGDESTAADAVDRSLEAMTQLDRNAHQAALLECWWDELGQIGAGLKVA